MKPDGMLAIVEWEGDTPYMYFFKDGIVPEKVVSINKINFISLVSVR